MRTRPLSLPRRLALYVAWAIVVLVAVWALMRARLPHAALASAGVGLIVGVGLLAVGELRGWAARRGNPRPLAFAVRVWAVGSVAWMAYVLAVSLPLALLTDVPSTRRGQDVMALITFLPLPLLYALAWTTLWRRTRRAPLS
ncbi:MAG: hypothetical protein EXR47_05090 [Dehalococcoidia bacterium]|nr:hypothetical protein [Dehalococcoidia bacterium]